MRWTRTGFIQEPTLCHFGSALADPTRTEKGTLLCDHPPGIVVCLISSIKLGCGTEVHWRRHRVQVLEFNANFEQLPSSERGRIGY